MANVRSLAHLRVLCALAKEPPRPIKGQQEATKLEQGGNEVGSHGATESKLGQADLLELRQQFGRLRSPSPHSISDSQDEPSPRSDSDSPHSPLPSQDCDSPPSPAPQLASKPSISPLLGRPKTPPRDKPRPSRQPRAVLPTPPSPPLANKRKPAVLPPAPPPPPPTPPRPPPDPRKRMRGVLPPPPPPPALAS